MIHRLQPLATNPTANPPTVTGLSALPFRQVVLSNTAILGVYYVLESGLLFFLTLLLARYLGVAEFGRLAFALSYGLMLSVLSDPGISLVVTKFVARTPDPTSQWISEGFRLRLLMVGGTLAIGFAPLSFSHYLRANAVLFVAIVVSEQIRGLTLTYCALFRGFQVMSLEAIVLGVERVSLLVAAYLLLRRGYRAEAIGYVYLGARVLSFLLAAAIFRMRIGAFGPKANLTLIRTIVREAFPLGVLV